MDIEFFETGYCTNIEKVSLKTGKWKTVKFPALVALMKHPEIGYILFDTGYSNHFFTKTKKFPYSIYPKITPVYFEQSKSIVYQLQQKGIPHKDIRYIFLSHLHADHIGGCIDFPQATFITSRSGYNEVKDKTGFQALKAAFIPELLPKDFTERLLYIEDEKKIELDQKYMPFTDAYDLFDDGSLLAVNLTGHAIGQYGLIIKRDEGKDVFLCADATWSSIAYRDLIPPISLAKLITSDYQSYRVNLERLHQLFKNNNNIRIIPSHCMETFEQER